MNQCNQQLPIDKCPSANEDDGDEINKDDYEDEDEDDLEIDEINQEPVTIKFNERRSSKWKPVWPGFNCVDCCGFCYFFYILFGCDKKTDHGPSSADETIKSSSSLFSYADIDHRPRRPTQMNIPLEMEGSKKDSIVSSVTINDNNDQH